ncbi:MAG: hypothetical protein ACFFDT_00195 [Candidatus Hodarchaeota archaeon]
MDEDPEGFYGQLETVSTTESSRRSNWDELKDVSVLFIILAVPISIVLMLGKLEYLVVGLLIGLFLSLVNN